MEVLENILGENLGDPEFGSDSFRGNTHVPLHERWGETARQAPDGRKHPQNTHPTEDLCPEQAKNPETNSKATRTELKMG